MAKEGPKLPQATVATPSTTTVLPRSRGTPLLSFSFTAQRVVWIGGQGYGEQRVLAPCQTPPAWTHAVSSMTEQSVFGRQQAPGCGQGFGLQVAG